MKDRVVDHGSGDGGGVGERSHASGNDGFSNTPIPLFSDELEQRRSGGRKASAWPLTFLGVRWGEGVYKDIGRRAPYYISDWTDAMNYRILPSTVYMYFANLLPALAFSFDMFESTDMTYGVNEVLLASFLGAGVFSLFSAQPLCIVGVTGPISVFNYTVFAIIKNRGTPYLPFMCWICLWSMVMHIMLAISNASNAVRWVTRFSCDVFGFYVAFIYLQKGVQILLLQWDPDTPRTTKHLSPAAPYLSISISILVFGVGYLCGIIGNGTLFNHRVRTFIRDYGTPLTVIFFTGYQYIGKMGAEVELLQLPTAVAFRPSMQERDWLVKFWILDAADVFLAIPFAILLTILFYFEIDHNISSLICQGTEFPLKKPGGFHWDILLLGITTGIAGILGIPAPNGLIPQAPFHTASLCVHPANTSTTEKAPPPTHVIEQRVSNLLQGILILCTMTPDLLSVLSLIPQSVLAGLFFLMGIQALEANGITHKLNYLIKDRLLVPKDHPLRQVRVGRIWAFVAVEVFVGFLPTFAVTQTIAAVGFPIIVAALVPLRWMVMLGRVVWTERELEVLDQPTASPFTLISVGGGSTGYGPRGTPSTTRPTTASVLQGQQHPQPPPSPPPLQQEKGLGFELHGDDHDGLGEYEKNCAYPPSEEDVLERGDARSLARRRRSEIAKWERERSERRGGGGGEVGNNTTTTTTTGATGGVASSLPALFADAGRGQGQGTGEYGVEHVKRE
ncbi:HCO3 transporter family protein [Peziza echinospora]|nr:HCO3 transporter family protein [Peziza echinospora]